MKRLTLALLLTLGIVAAASAHNGATGFIPTIPDPNLMSIDGNDDDWGWIEADFVIGPEQWFDAAGELSGQGFNPAPEDWSAFLQYAWSPPPDNSLYLFSRVIDDTLRAGESEVKRNWWNDDTLEFNMDMDHTGGPMSWVSTEETRNGYRINVHPLYDDQLGGTISIDTQEPGFEDWGAMPPHAFTATTLLPAEAGHLSANVEYSYEMKVASPYVTYDILGPDASTPHVFEPDQTIHLITIQMDGDKEANGQQNIWTTEGGIGRADNGDLLTDYIILATVDLDSYPDVSTSVEGATWGRIKNHLSR